MREQFLPFLFGRLMEFFGQPHEEEGLGLLEPTPQVGGAIEGDACFEQFDGCPLFQWLEMLGESHEFGIWLVSPFGDIAEQLTQQTMFLMQSGEVERRERGNFDMFDPDIIEVAGCQADVLNGLRVPCL
jgi:hypothetical protein